MRKIFWYIIIALAFSLLLAVIGTYYFWFKHTLNYVLSDRGEVWGQFGDYLGGVLNPILSFITIIILIITAIYQQNQNELTDKREQTRRFEDRFYGMLSYQKSSLEIFQTSVLGKENLDAKQLITLMENELFDSERLSFIKSIESKDLVFQFIRQFYLLLKMIDDATIESTIDKKEKVKYYRWLINLTDFNLMRLIVFSSIFHDDLAASKYILSNGEFMGEIKAIGMGKYIESINEKKQKIIKKTV
ncbi:hypothetical protein [Rahnella aceris]|uniref:hypothetical protein n=1 Tax=Rahnella sp. (strain Y9602) TaxID=2703885 RepID=UPI003FD40187